MMDQLLQHIQNWINPLYLLCFLTLSYTIRDLFKDTFELVVAKVLKKTVTFRNVYVVLTMALFLSIPFYIYDPCSDCVIKLLFTYCLGTSIYEVFLKNFSKVVDKYSEAITGGNNKSDEP